MSGIKGIDVSTHQGNIDWSKVAQSGVQFAILRAGYGRYSSQKDSRFESYYVEARAEGIPVGAYWYSYAMSPEEARQEADACLEVLRGKRYEYPIYYDVEEAKQLELGKEKLSAIIRAFLERVEAAGYFVGLYSNLSTLTNLVDESIRTRYTIWLAHWDVDKSSYSGAYGLWQYKVGQTPGISGECDLDYAYEDFPVLIKANGLNGYVKQAEEKPPENTAPDTIDVTLTVNGKQYSGKLAAE